MDNEMYLLKEDIECVHLYLDDKKIPRQDLNGQNYSMVGRIKQLEIEHQRQLSILESYYLTKQ